MLQIIKRTAYLCIGATLFIVGLNRLIISTSGQLESFSSTIVYPFLVLQKTLLEPFGKWVQNYKTKRQLEQILQNYKQENENLQAQIIELKATYNFEQNTNDLVSFASRYKTQKAILAQIILKNFDDKSHFFLIDAGINKNITRDLAIVYKNCLIGRITEVYPNYSKVTLITDKACKIAAFCASNRVQGIHEGQNLLTNTRLNYVNHLQTINNGDLILSSGEGLIFPRGFALGRIKNFNAVDLNYEIEIEPMVDLKNLEYCYAVEKGVILEEQVEATPIVEPEDIAKQSPDSQTAIQDVQPNTLQQGHNDLQQSDRL